MVKLSELDQRFVDKHHLNELLLDAMVALDSKKPPDPVDFLCHFFRRYRERLPEVKACEVISRCHYLHFAYEQHMVDAYGILMDYENLRPDYAGLNGESLSKLLQLLCAGMSQYVKDRLLARIECRPGEFVPFGVFRYCVTTCLLMKDYMREADLLYNSMISPGRLNADEGLCAAALHQLRAALAEPGSAAHLVHTPVRRPVHDAEDTPDRRKYDGRLVMAGYYATSPEPLRHQLRKVELDPKNATKVSFREEFLNNIADAFLNHIRPL